MAEVTDRNGLGNGSKLARSSNSGETVSYDTRFGLFVSQSLRECVTVSARPMSRLRTMMVAYPGVQGLSRGRSPNRARHCKVVSRTQIPTILTLGTSWTLPAKFISG